MRPVFLALLATPLVSAPLRLPAQSPRDAASRGIQAADGRSIVAYNAGDVSAFAPVNAPDTTELDVHGNTASEMGTYELDVRPANGPAAHDPGKYIVPRTSAANTTSAGFSSGCRPWIRRRPSTVRFSESLALVKADVQQFWTMRRR